LFKDYTEKHTDGSNAFIYSRFLVPWLCRWSGAAIFLDGDMIVKDDIAELWAERDFYKAVQVVKHDYKTKYPVKYLGNKNEDYPKKNQSSVILWNCNHFHNRLLTPNYVEKATGSHLHQFKWLDDEIIGELPKEWNKLVLEEEPNPNAKLEHFSIGIPAFPEYDKGPEAAEWWKEYQKTVRPL
jgi:lipopolysaccharide biosynthesis glycosyltransferase